MVTSGNRHVVLAILDIEMFFSVVLRKFIHTGLYILPLYLACLNVIIKGRAV